ncbi:hypothetical protein BTH42_02160 [Burkholderia sp. SRS-W-2-2016]|uniref:type IV toxin-antitoxin system AbiEi family antitoxin n=1 Tax=Burkholderia sp. SRS-W-2-2016 TaxID=1926878 RepID=UPI00094B290E|nr:type IV toxin-antitoxin system AbiEi family antitoxin [Burkholderia sp. SRS-W-2-2016]OLL33328.1 hypothetical protein BTH42_02160 [Burkholderia sp. SRS-W-2-2016]
MADKERLSSSDQMALSLACEAFARATQHFHAELQISPRRPDSTGALIQFSISGKHFDMPAVFLKNATASRYFAKVHDFSTFPRHNAGRRPMLVTYYVTPKLADTLIHHRIPFLDTAGNAYFDEPEATVMITGRDSPALKQTDTTSRSTTPKGLQVSFALATLPNLVASPYRTIAEMAGVALNTVNVAIDDLIARRLVVVKRNGSRAIADQGQFIKEWVTQYPTGLRTRLGARRYASGLGIDWWRDEGASILGARLSGECAADVLTHDIKPASVTLYVQDGVSPELMRSGRLRPDGNGAVEILDAFWPGQATSHWDSPPHVVHPLLVFADLIGSGDSRNQEIAATIYERYLAH